MANRDQAPASAIGFRLANELEGLLEGISADGVITPAETERVRQWLDEGARYLSVQPFSELDARLTAILADAVITMEECEDLLWVVRKYTRVNPYCDQLYAGIQILIAMLAGMAADDKFGSAELARLAGWVDEWDQLRGLWPYDEVAAITASIMANRRISAEQAACLRTLAAQFPIARAKERPPLLIRDVCATDPVITFQDRMFVVAGESRQCERRVFSQLVVERGAQVSDSVTADTDYLVVCDGGNEYWAFSCYGRHVERACQLRRRGEQVAIVREEDFWEAIAASPAGTV